MGLDIDIGVDNNDKIFTPAYYDLNNGYRKTHNLSRTFCNFMCRRGVVSGIPELDQIGVLTSVDISPLYEMETYGHEEELNFLLEVSESDDERQMILDKFKRGREKIKGNIDKVLITVTSLIHKLSTIYNLHELLNDNGYSTLNYKDYFANFTVEQNHGNFGNTFGQDLKNFKQFLEFAKKNGTSTVYFNYA